MSLITRRRAAASVAVVVLGVASFGALAACGGSDDSSSSGSTTTSVAPEAVFAPDAEVTAGLATLRTMFQDAHDAIVAKSATVSEFPDKLEDAWFAIEGTVKKNDPGSYISMEDALARASNAAKNDSAAEAQKAITTFNAAADAYLAKHP